MSSLVPREDTPEPPNGGYGWVVVVGSFFVHVFVLGNVYSFGVLYPVLIKDFHASYGTIAWIGSIAFGVMAGIASFTGQWADKFGNSPVAFAGGIIISLAYFLASISTELWHLFVTLGLLAGVGYSLGFVSGVSVVSQWFTTRRGLAVGLAVSGSGLGQFAVALTTGYLIDGFGWRGALQFLALINVVGISLSALLIRRFLPRFAMQKHESSMQFFTDTDFTTLYCGVFFGSLGTNMQYVHITSYALLHGVSSSDAVLLVALMGVASAVGRISIGYLGDYFGKMRMFQGCFICAGICTFCWIACTTFPALMAFVIFFGFFGGGVISLIPSVSSLLFGLEKQGNVLGLLLTATACGNLLSSPIAGFIFDAYQVYYPSILVAGSFIVCGAGFILSVKVKEAHPLNIVLSPPETPNSAEDDMRSLPEDAL